VIELRIIKITLIVIRILEYRFHTQFMKREIPSEL